MYLRAAHAESHIPSLRNFIRQNALGILISAFPSERFPLLQASHIPWIIDVQDDSSETELGRLRGHMARANPQAKVLIEAGKEQLARTNHSTLQQEVLIMFNGPAHHYVTPKFYVETKPKTGKVVPTWNYSAVQAYGQATIHFDTSAEATGQFLSKQIRDLSDYAETDVMDFTGKDGKPTAWHVEDAPPQYVDLLQKSIIGIEIEITRLEGKFKMSQEMGYGDRQGVIEGFKALDTDIGDAISSTVEARGQLKDEQKAMK